MSVIPDSQNPAQPLNRERLTWDQAIELLLACGLSHAFAFRIVRDMYRAGFADGADHAAGQIGEAYNDGCEWGYNDTLQQISQALSNHPKIINHLLKCGFDIPATADEPEDAQ